MLRSSSSLVLRTRSGKYAKGTVLTVEVTPDSETSAIITVTVNGAAVAPEADGSYKITVDGIAVEDQILPHQVIAGHADVDHRAFGNVVADVPQAVIHDAAVNGNLRVDVGAEEDIVAVKDKAVLRSGRSGLAALVVALADDFLVVTSWITTALWSVPRMSALPWAPGASRITTPTTPLCLCC